MRDPVLVTQPLDNFLSARKGMGMKVRYYVSLIGGVDFSYIYYLYRETLGV